MKEILRSCQSLREQSIESGQVFLDEGDMTGLMYILIEGEVEILKGDFKVTIINEPGSILGEISALLDIPHTATVKTVTPCRFYVVDKQSDFLKDNPEICLPLAVMLARRLHSVTNYLVDVKEQFKDQSDHFGMMGEILETLVTQQGEEQQPGSERDPF
ncbi:MAG: cyclic nucleotide-binding domain-containing protein [Gammaproteobacteria bacterium]|nr:cyclic nucleotide-binding domain-containing protein [Gammaproteobacteria bacterium]